MTHNKKCIYFFPIFFVAICASFRIYQEIQCLPYAGFFFYVSSQLKINQLAALQLFNCPPLQMLNCLSVQLFNFPPVFNCPTLQL